MIKNHRHDRFREDLLAFRIPAQRGVWVWPDLIPVPGLGSSLCPKGCTGALMALSHRIKGEKPNINIEIK